MATAKELVVKAGRKDVGINSKVWIGEAVSRASNLSSLGNKDGLAPIVFSDICYQNFIDQLVEICGEEARTWFTERYKLGYGTCYDANIIIIDFDNWIENGMKD